MISRIARAHPFRPRRFSTTVMAAVARDANAPFQMEELTLSAPQSEELVVRIVSTGICHTDVHTKSHGFCAFPSVLGHEGTGVVESFGSAVTGVDVGDHVIMSYAACGNCSACHGAKPSYCAQHGALNFAGARPDGSSTLCKGSEEVSGAFFQQSSFATHALTHRSNIIKVSKDLPLGIFAPLGCAAQTGAGAVLNTFNARPGSTVAVFGCGAVGLSAVMASAMVASASRVIAVDINAGRLQLARELGATHTHQLSLGPDSMDETIAAIMDATDGQGVQYAVDTSGKASAMQTAVKSLAPMGVCGMIAPGGPGQTLELTTMDLLAGKQFRGIIQGDSVAVDFIPKMIGFWQQGIFPFDKFTTYYESLDAINDAVGDMHSGDTIKPVLKVDHDPKFWL